MITGSSGGSGYCVQAGLLYLRVKCHLFLCMPWCNVPLSNHLHMFNVVQEVVVAGAMAVMTGTVTDHPGVTAAAEAGHLAGAVNAATAAAGHQHIDATAGVEAGAGLHLAGTALLLGKCGIGVLSTAGNRTLLLVPRIRVPDASVRQVQSLGGAMVGRVSSIGSYD